MKKYNMTYEYLDTYFTGYLKGTVSDEVMTNILRYICKNGMSEEEVFYLVDIFLKSGEMFDLNENFIDKHSTGGVGDKTTLIILPILAALKVKVSKMSGKALGHTGGTIDKLNSIGVKTDFTKEEFYNNLDNFNMVISSQTENLCPMDKKIYALRDVTGTTKSIPLIATSIMSKKIASGASKILLDVKIGKGALVSNKKEGRKLAKLMINIGKKYNREVVCMLTRMDNPLGDNIGNKIEIMEVIDILKNNKRNDLSILCIEMASIMYSMNKGILIEEARSKVMEVLENKEAYNCFSNYVLQNGGNLDIDLPEPEYILSRQDGYIAGIDSEKIGLMSMKKGAGRLNKDEEIDYNAGIILGFQTSSYVEKGDELAKVYGDKKIDLEEIYKAFKFSYIKKKNYNIIIEIIGNH